MVPLKLVRFEYSRWMPVRFCADEYQAHFSQVR